MTDETPDQPDNLPAEVEPVAEVIGPLPNGWHLVKFGSWEVSVDPQGMLRLPGFLHPDETMDFAICARTAAEVGTRVRAENAERARRTGGDGLPVGAIIVREGPPPPGAMRLPYSTHGRQKSRQPRQGRGVT
jgi:hypothetical protein